PRCSELRRAGSRFAEMGAGFKVDVGCRPGGEVTRHPKGFHLGMGASVTAVIPPSDDRAVFHQDTSNPRIGAYATRPSLGQADGHPHVMFVSCPVLFVHSATPSRCSRMRRARSRPIPGMEAANSSGPVEAMCRMLPYR